VGVYFGQFFKYKNSLHFVLVLYTVKVCNNFDKYGLGYILGDFFTNPSGHPGGRRHSDFTSKTFVLGSILRNSISAKKLEQILILVMRLKLNAKL
jgi:hypothetical protein